MIPADPDLRTGLIIIRLWSTGEPGGLRSSLVIKLDVASDAEEHAGAASVDALCSEVRRWAEAFLAAQTGPSEAPNAF